MLLPHLPATLIPPSPSSKKRERISTHLQENAWQRHHETWDYYNIFTGEAGEIKSSLSFFSFFLSMCGERVCVWKSQSSWRNESVLSLSLSLSCFFITHVQSSARWKIFVCMRCFKTFLLFWKPLLCRRSIRLSARKISNARVPSSEFAVVDSGGRPFMSKQKMRNESGPWARPSCPLCPNY